MACSPDSPSLGHSLLKPLWSVGREVLEGGEGGGGLGPKFCVPKMARPDFPIANSIAFGKAPQRGERDDHS